MLPSALLEHFFFKSLFSSYSFIKHIPDIGELTGMSRHVQFSMKLLAVFFLLEFQQHDQSF